jgi:hypothetical protein
VEIVGKALLIEGKTVVESGGHVKKKTLARLGFHNVTRKKGL